MNAPAIADAKAADVKRRRQRRAFGRGENLIVDRQFDPQLRQPRPQRGDVFELGDFGEGHGGECGMRNSEGGMQKNGR